MADWYITIQDSGCHWVVDFLSLPDIIDIMTSQSSVGIRHRPRPTLTRPDEPAHVHISHSSNCPDEPVLI